LTPIIKVEFALEQTMKVQKNSRDTVLHFH
jgi:hypothetical protein